MCACWRRPIAIRRMRLTHGHLRADLFYRLNVFHIHMPPLREHMEDLPAMAEAMVHEMNQKHTRQVSGCRDRFWIGCWPMTGREMRANCATRSSGR